MIKRRLISLICLLTMLSGAGLLSGCGLGKAAGSSPAATATPTTTTYTSADGEYRLLYPTDWTYTNLGITAKFSDAVLFNGNNDADQFLVEPLTKQVVTNYPAFLQDYLSSSNSPNTTVDTTTTTVSYPSGVWTVASATTVFDGAPIMVVLYGIVHSGHTVVILTYAPTSSATTDQATYFAPMLTSFTFLK